MVIIMADTTIKKIDSNYSPRGESGQKYLASGKQISMRLWQNETPSESKPESRREYETVGYVLKGKAELHCEGQVVSLQEGDSWVVPKGAAHSYHIIEEFSAVEATCPPCEVKGRDLPQAQSDGAETIKLEENAENDRLGE
jgi:quercetin dioxygenase-like cupin family protein